MNILISFNNVYQFPGFPLLGMLDTESLDLKILDLPPQIPQTGALGLAQSSRFIFVGLQYAFDATTSFRIPPQIGLEYSQDGMLASLNPCSLLIFDRNDFRLVGQYYFKHVQDVHSFLLSDDEQTLYVVSTGTDEVIQIQLEDEQVVSESVFWNPDPDGERADHHHLNSICTWNGDILVSGFGRKEVADDWNTARNGFVFNINKGTFVHQGLLQPHSLVVIDGRLGLCESRSKRFIFIDDGSTIEMGGYSRGICQYKNHLFAGTSARRAKSKSTGRPNKYNESDLTGCTVRKISLQDYSHTQIIHPDHCANEIYEMLPVEKTDHWPLIPAIDYRALFQHAWENQRRLALAEIKVNCGKVYTALVLIDEELLGLKKNDISSDLTIYSIIEKNGIYWGPPENDAIAIEELKRIKSVSPDHLIAFAWTTFWWQDVYKKVFDFIHTHYICVLKSERVIIYRPS